MSQRHQPTPRYRFARDGRVVVDERRPGPTVGTSDYENGDRLFAPGRCSEARFRFRGATRKS